MIIDKSRKILTIDDEEGLRRSFRMFFEDEDYLVFEASNGREGIEVCREVLPDIVLVDLRMPEMDGLAVIEVLTKEFPELPIIVVSGTGVLEDAIGAIRAGATDYITKPVTDLLVLGHTVEQALFKAELIKENRSYQENLEELVEQRTNELRQAQKMEAIGTLAGGIAHDFNNILTGIMGFNELALMRCQDESVNNYLLEMQKGATRAKELVQQILTFSRKNESKKTSLQVAPVIKEAVKLLRSSFPPTIELNQDIVANNHVLIGPSEVHQVVMNLGTNAYHAMGDSGGAISISLRDVVVHDGDVVLGLDGFKAGHYLELKVSDSGSGIEPECLARIFDPYFTTKDTGHGTGLGLSVVHGIVSSCGGRISVQSELGKGTTIVVYLPVSEVNPHHDEEFGEVKREVLQGNESILFVDDEVSLTVIAEKVCKSFGYDISVYTDSEEALAAYLAEPDKFDIVITDMAMPKMNGGQLAQKILAQNPNCPIVLCTGYSAVVNRPEAIRLGVREFVQKPVPVSELLTVVRGILD